MVDNVQHYIGYMLLCLIKTEKCVDFILQLCSLVDTWI